MRGIPAWVDTPHAWQPLLRCLPHRLLDAVEPSEIINVYPEAVVFPLIVVQVCPLARLLASEEAYTKLRHGVLNHGSGHVLLSITLILVFSFERIRIRFFIFRLSGMFRIPCHQVALKKIFLGIRRFTYSSLRRLLDLVEWDFLRFFSPAPASSSISSSRSDILGLWRSRDKGSSHDRPVVPVTEHYCSEVPTVNNSVRRRCLSFPTIAEFIYTLLCHKSCWSDNRISNKLSTMFGCCIAGRLLQTNLQQIDETHALFELPQASTINHVCVFLLGTSALSITLVTCSHVVFLPCQ